MSTESKSSSSFDISIEEKVQQFAYVENLLVKAPLNRFLLIKNRDSFCAVKFTSFQKGQKSSSLCRMREHYLYGKGEYDWYYSEKKNLNIKYKNIKSGHEKVNRTPRVALWIPLTDRPLFIFHLGYDKINCGKLSFKWSYPSGVQNKDEKRRTKYPDLKFAPTKWKDFSKVNFHDPSLEWFGPYSNVKQNWIPLKDLPPKNLKEKFSPLPDRQPTRKQN